MTCLQDLKTRVHRLLEEENLDAKWIENVQILRHRKNTSGHGHGQNAFGGNLKQQYVPEGVAEHIEGHTAKATPLAMSRPVTFLSTADASGGILAGGGYMVRGKAVEAFARQVGRHRS